MNILEQFGFHNYELSDPAKVPLLAIMGPTASGKTKFSSEIAKYLPIEIISADSMQFYKELNIGVAKPEKTMIERIPHHLLNICSIKERVHVYTFIELAEKARSAIRERGRIPLLVGGSGLYIRSFFYGLDPLPADKELRKTLDEKFDSPEGFEELKTIMSKKNPEDFKRWKQHLRKLIRAYEVFLLTGNSITELQKSWSGNLKFPVDSVFLQHDRKVLRDRIAERTDEMLESGWIEETEDLINKGFLQSPTAAQAIGYKIIAEYLSGKIDYQAMRMKIINSTRQYARRQESWFRNKHPEARTVIFRLPDI